MAGFPSTASTSLLAVPVGKAGMLCSLGVKLDLLTGACGVGSGDSDVEDGVFSGVGSGSSGMGVDV